MTSKGKVIIYDSAAGPSGAKSNLTGTITIEHGGYLTVRDGQNMTTFPPHRVHQIEWSTP